MIERDAAVQMVEEELERNYQRDLAAGLEPIRMAVAHVKQHELAWVISWTSEEYLRIRNPDFMVAGVGVLENVPSEVRTNVCSAR